MPCLFVSTPKSVCVKHSRSISRSFSLRWKIGIKLSLENRYLLVFFALKNHWLKNTEIGILSDVQNDRVE